MKYCIGLAAVLFICSCNPNPTAPGQAAPAPGETAVQKEYAPEASLPLQPIRGWIVCGGSWTAGKGADLGAGYADQLGEDAVNAGISGEPLPGLLERLPKLLKQEPGGLILEIGYEDEALRAPVDAFKRHLDALEQLLRAYPGLSLLFIVSTTNEAYRKPILNSAKRLDAPTLTSPHFSKAPSSLHHSALAQQLLEML